MRSNIIFVYEIVILMCQSVNLSWKIVVQNACCAFAYFVAGTKIICSYNFVAAACLTNQIQKRVTLILSD